MISNILIFISDHLCPICSACNFWSYKASKGFDNFLKSMIHAKQASTFVFCSRSSRHFECNGPTFCQKSSSIVSHLDHRLFCCPAVDGSGSTPSSILVFGCFPSSVATFNYVNSSMASKDSNNSHPSLVSDYFQSCCCNSHGYLKYCECL